MHNNLNFEFYETTGLQKREFLLYTYVKQALFPLNLCIDKILKVVDIEALQKTFNAIVERHKVFRTTLMMKNGKILQKVWPYHSSIVNIDFLDISTTNNQTNIFNELIAKIDEKLFLPDQYPWLHVCLIKLHENDYYLKIAIPHRIIDFESIKYLKEEMNILYRAYLNNENVILPKAFQYGDYINAINQELKTYKGLKHKAFWKKLLTDLPSVNLSTKYSNGQQERVKSYKEQLFNELKIYHCDCSNKVLQSFMENIVYIIPKPGNIYSFFLNKENLETLSKISFKTNINLQIIIQTTFYLLVYKLTMENDIIIGMNTNLRDNINLKNVLGFITNTVFTRHKVNKDQYIIDFVKDVYTSYLKSCRHKIYPSEKVFYDTDISFQQIGSLFLNVMSDDNIISEKIDDFKPKHIERRVYTYFDLDVHIRIHLNCVEYWCHYCSEVFAKSSIEFIFSQYVLMIDKLNNFLNYKVEDLLFEAK